MYSGLTFTEGAPTKVTSTSIDWIRHHEAPKAMMYIFVQNEIDPTGLGEPPFPPVMAALANALYKASGKRFYSQPFIKDVETSALRMLS